MVMRALACVWGIYRKHDQVGTRSAGTVGECEFYGYKRFGISKFSDQGFGDFLTDVLVGRFVALGPPVNEVKKFALLDNDGTGLNGGNIFGEQRKERSVVGHGQCLGSTE